MLNLTEKADAVKQKDVCGDEFDGNEPQVEKKNRQTGLTAKSRTCKSKSIHWLGLSSR